MKNLPEELDQENYVARQGVRKKNRRRKLLCELLLDFAKNTTLHGLRYITERGLSAVEKIFWIITFLTSLAVCLWLMSNVWVKWQTSPVIVSLSEKLMSVTEVPFPAVTICPQAKIDQNKYNYTDLMVKFYTSLWSRPYYTTRSRDEEAHNITDHHPEMNLLNDLGLICKDKAYLYWSDMADPDRENVQRVNHSVVQTIQEMAPQLQNISGLSSNRWRDESFELNEYLEPVLTKEGLCYTFNSLPYNEILNINRIQDKYSYLNASIPLRGWSLSQGYFSTENNDTYPRRGQANSANPDLILTLREIPNRDVLCDGYNRGFKVYLHHPADLPQSSLYYYSVPPGQVAAFAIKVSVMNTSDTLKQYLPSVRQCYFPLEKELRYFKLYTLKNCQLECSANYTLEICDCVWFHMPHSDSTKLCHYSMEKCVTKALEKHAYEEGRNSSSCNCLPSCVSVQYEAEVIKTDYEAHAFYKATDDFYRRVWNVIEHKTTYTESESDREFYKSAKTYSKIEMYFKEPRFVSMRRSELFGLTDFLANCGGLLGLFLGFSFLSLIEIFYFFTLRFTCKLRRNKIAEKNNKGDHLKTV